MYLVLLIHRITEAQNVCVGTSRDHLVQLRCSRSHRTHYAVLSLDTFWIPPWKEKLQPLLATCFSAPLPSQEISLSSYSGRISCVAVCAHCLLLYCWAPLRIYLHFLDILLSDTYTRWSDPPWAFSSTDWIGPDPWVFPHMRDAPVP